MNDDELLPTPAAPRDELGLAQKELERLRAENVLIGKRIERPAVFRYWILCVLASLSVAGVGGYFLGGMKTRRDGVAAARVLAKKDDAELERVRKRIADCGTASTKADAELVECKRELERTVSAAPAPTNRYKPLCTCLPHDPLCSCL